MDEQFIQLKNEILSYLNSTVDRLRFEHRAHRHQGITDEKMNNYVERIDGSFETGEQASINLYTPFAIRIVRVRARTTKALAATDAGTVVVKDHLGATAATISFPASTVINTDGTAVVPTANNLIPRDSFYSVVFAKTTAGGKAIASIEVERL